MCTLWRQQTDRSCSHVSNCPSLKRSSGYFVYWIVSGRLSYIGATVAPHQRCVSTTASWLASAAHP